MPTLIIEQPERDQNTPAGAAEVGGAVLRKTRRAGSFNRRVLIGRLPCCGIRCDDSAVSRLHAWIVRDDGGCWIVDGGSLTGTILNGQPISQRTALKDGDYVRIGQTTIQYRASAQLPAGANAAQLENIPHAPPARFGVVFDCVCGAPSWVKWTGVGKPFHCRQCGYTVLPPAIPGALARRAAADSIVENRADHPPLHHASDSAVHGTVHAHLDRQAPTTLLGAGNGEADAHRNCSICHTAIHSHEPETTCPECGLTFHRQCWQENYGCSAYGCSQVNVLKPPEAVEHAAAPVSDAQDKFPWEYILLAGSALCVLLSALTFGIPSVISGAVSVIYLLIAKPRRRGLVMLAAAIAVVGVATGVLASLCWWFHRFTWQGK